MEKIIHSESVKTSLAALGWSQKVLAEKVGVSPQSVTNWLQGVDFPRPDKLLKLATNLSLSFDQLVTSSAKPPIVAFRKKANSVTTDKHLANAADMGELLKSIVPFLPLTNALVTKIQSPSLEYDKLQAIVSDVREKIGIGSSAVLEYKQLINQFSDNGAVIIPVMWGSKQHHGNALHLLLPDENTTFIYLNLDTHLEDFKFWMAHELAHVYTPDLAGKIEGEDFADAFAGALLFPKVVASEAYSKCASERSKTAELKVLSHFANMHDISLYSVYCEVVNFAKATNLPKLRVIPNDIHALRNFTKGPLVGKAIFHPSQPDAASYIGIAHSIFQSPFFSALKKMILEFGTGAGYVQQLLDISIKDAMALHKELIS